MSIFATSVPAHWTVHTLDNVCTFEKVILLSYFTSSGLKIDKLPCKLMKEHPETESVHESRPQWMILVPWVGTEAVARQKLGQRQQLVKCATKLETNIGQQEKNMKLNHTTKTNSFRKKRKPIQAPSSSAAYSLNFCFRDACLMRS